MTHASQDSSEQGQALIVIALSMTVLVAALAFAVDWGYAIAQRTVTQNLADASALGAGKYLATSVVKVNGAIGFSVTQEQTWCVANGYANPSNLKSSFAPANTTNQLALYYGDASSPTVWTAGRATCTGSTAVPGNTIYVRAVVSVTFASLVAASLGNGSSTSSESARVRLSGTPVPSSGPVLSLVRHYNPADYDITCVTPPCDPTNPSQVQPFTFWCSSGPDCAYGQFKGLVDYSRFSPNFMSLNQSVTTRQLVTQWDRSAHAPNPLKIDQSGNSPGQGQCTAWGKDAQGNSLWDSVGEANISDDKKCSIMNWLYYSFKGTLALDTPWTSSALVGEWSGQEAPTPLPTRAVCSPAPDPAPSCGPAANADTLGDWVETANGQEGQSFRTVVTRALVNLGTTMPYSNDFVPGTSTKFGKGLVALVYLWDCGESFSKNAAAGNRWTLITPAGSSDCSQVTAQTNSTPDRVHLFTVAAFTFYEGLVGTNDIRGYWGGLFGSPDACQSCPLNALANTAVLVPD